MTEDYEAPEVFDLGEADELIQGAGGKNAEGCGCLYKFSSVFNPTLVPELYDEAEAH